jgi:hypothetical protein
VKVTSHRSPDRVLIHRSASESEPPETGPVCELCGGTVEQLHCKIKCLTCGYFRDCSDP